MSQDTTIALSEQLSEAALHFFNGGSWAFFLLGLVLLPALMLGIVFMIQLATPGLTERSASALRERNFVSFVAGLPILGAVLATLHVVKGSPHAAVAVITIGSSLILLGWTAASEDLGRRLFWVSGREGGRSSHLASGWMVFSLASCFPILGWFLIFPYVSVAGLGSLLVGALRGGAPQAAVQRPF